MSSGDLPRPPVHARNLFHTSIAMYDAWAAYDDTAAPYLVDESPASSDVEADRAIAISFAAYRVIRHRFANAVNKTAILRSLDDRFAALGYDQDYTTTQGDSPQAVGNRIAAAVIAEASLSFLGLGQQPPDPSWGSMLNTAKNYVEQAPWMAVWPGLAIFALVLAFNLVGDGLRDALDPRQV